MPDDLNSISNLSRINEAGNQVLRIGGLWGEANTAAKSGLLIRWNSIMERVWSELSADATVEERKEFKKINESLKDLRINFSFGSLPKSRKPKFIIKLMDIQYLKLMDKDLFLRELQNSQGKGTLYKDEFEDDYE